MFFKPKPPKVLTPVEMVELAMKHIGTACNLLEGAIKDHRVGPSFQAGMIDSLRSCIKPNLDLNKGTLPLLIKVLNGERIVPMPKPRKVPISEIDSRPAGTNKPLQN